LHTLREGRDRESTQPIRSRTARIANIARSGNRDEVAPTPQMKVHHRHDTSVRDRLAAFCISTMKIIRLSDLRLPDVSLIDVIYMITIYCYALFYRRNSSAKGHHFVKTTLVQTLVHSHQATMAVLMKLFIIAVCTGICNAAMQIVGKEGLIVTSGAISSYLREKQTDANARIETVGIVDCTGRSDCSLLNSVVGASFSPEEVGKCGECCTKAFRF
jgi:hypothetical protein